MSITISYYHIIGLLMCLSINVLNSTQRIIIITIGVCGVYHPQTTSHYLIFNLLSTAIYSNFDFTCLVSANIK